MSINKDIRKTLQWKLKAPKRLNRHSIQKFIHGNCVYNLLYKQQVKQIWILEKKKNIQELSILAHF